MVWHGAFAVLAVASVPCLYVVAEPRRTYQTNTPNTELQEDWVTLDMRGLVDCIVLPKKAHTPLHFREWCPTRDGSV